MRSNLHLVPGAFAALAVILTPPAAPDSWAGEPDAPARSYSYRVVARTGDTIPDVDVTLVGAFNVGDINARGDVVFDALTDSGGTAILLLRGGRLRKVALTGETAPGGGTYSPFTLGPSSLNDWGDVAFDFLLEPIGLPFGTTGGIFRQDAFTGAVRAVVLSGTTPDPRGGVLRGETIRASVNNRREVLFGAIIATSDGVSGDLGNAVMEAPRDGQPEFVLAPGDPAPDGSHFDMAMNPSSNVLGQVAIAGHQSNQECIDFGGSQEVFINCATSVYLAQPDGRVRAIALQGDQAPGGGTYRFAWSPWINARGQVVFVGDLSPAPGFNQSSGLFLHERGRTRAIVRPGDAMPDGGRVVVVTNFSPANVRLNDRGQAAFNAVLDTGDGESPDTGLYLWSPDGLVRVARTGTVILGVGTIASVQAAAVNVGLSNIGQVAFSARLVDGSEALLIATPHH